MCDNIGVIARQLERPGRVLNVQHQSAQIFDIHPLLNTISMNESASLFPRSEFAIDDGENDIWG